MNFASCLSALVCLSFPNSAPVDARMDAHGDALPTGAVSRLGTVRLRAEGAVGILRFSSDGRLLAFARDSSPGSKGWVDVGDRSIYVADVHTGETLRVIPGNGRAVSCVAFSPCGKLLASASNDAKVRLWDLVSRAPLWTIDLHREWRDPLSECEARSALRLRFTDDGRSVHVIAARSGTPLTLLIETQTGRCIRSTTTSSAEGPFADGPPFLDSADASQIPLVFGSTKADRDRMSRISSRVAKFTYVGIAGRRKEGSLFWIAPNHRRLVACSGTNISIFDIVSERRLGAFTLQNAPAAAGAGIVVFSDDARLMAVLSSPGRERSSVEIRKVDDGCLLRTIEPTNSPRAMEFSPDSVLLAIADGGKVRLWNIVTGLEVCATTGHTGAVDDVTFSRDSRFCATTGRDHTVRLWEVQTGKQIRVFNGLPHVVSQCTAAFSHDGETLVVATDRLHVVRSADGQALATVLPSLGLGAKDEFSMIPRTYAPCSWALSFTDDGTLASWPCIAAHEKGMASMVFRTLFHWEVPSMRKLRTTTLEMLPSTLEAENWGVDNAGGGQAVSQDGRLIAGTTATRQWLGVFDTETGKALFRWKCISEPKGESSIARMVYRTDIMSICFSPDAATLAVGFYGGRIALFDIQSGQQLRTFGRDGVTHFPRAFVDGANLLISEDVAGSQSSPTSRSTTVWDIRTGREVSRFGNIGIKGCSSSGRLAAGAASCEDLLIWDLEWLRSTAGAAPLPGALGVRSH